jgi:hypothetical protein
MPQPLSFGGRGYSSKGSGSCRLYWSIGLRVAVGVRVGVGVMEGVGVGVTGVFVGMGRDVLVAGRVKRGMVGVALGSAVAGSGVQVEGISDCPDMVGVSVGATAAEASVGSGPSIANSGSWQPVRKSITGSQIMVRRFIIVGSDRLKLTGTYPSA